MMEQLADLFDEKAGKAAGNVPGEPRRRRRRA